MKINRNTSLNSNSSSSSSSSSRHYVGDIAARAAPSEVAAMDIWLLGGDGHSVHQERLPTRVVDSGAGAFFAKLAPGSREEGKKGDQDIALLTLLL